MMNELSGKRVTVAGLGHFGGGIAVSRWLVQQGAVVLVTDMAKAKDLEESCRQLAGLPIEYRLGEHREEDFTSADLVVASPAIPPQSRYLAAARAKGVPITTEIRLFIERCAARIVGVTGTKGKSTTTTLLERMLRRRHMTHLGGNMGKSLLAGLPEIQPEHLVVLELSSFMLEYLAADGWSPHVALVTFLARDHIDRHGSVEAYMEAKKGLVKYQKAGDFAVLHENCPYREEFSRAGGRKVVLYGLEGRRPFELKIMGGHNQLNAQAAFVAASCLGVSWEEAQEAVRDFDGLSHRLQLVHERDGVRYFNDSIATIPEAAVAAMESFPPRTVIQILGGHDKKLSLECMFGPLARRTKAVLCIGITGTAIADGIEKAGGNVHRCGDLPTAMKVARELACLGDVVLLSPGCASYGEFHNFEERGEIFERLARED